MIATLTGGPGSGKTTVSKLLAERGWRVVRTDALRVEGERLGIDVTEMNRLASLDESIDRAIDLATRRIEVAPGEKVVVEARMGFAFVPQDVANLSVKLVCDDAIAGQRVFAANRADERYGSAREAVAALQERRRLEIERYRTLYGLSYEDAVADQTIATDEMSPWAIADVIEERARRLEEDTRLGVVGPFRGEYEWLSNMHSCACEVVVDGCSYPCACAESAYQLQKASDLRTREQMAAMGGREAKAFARTMEIRSDWNQVRCFAMMKALEAKYFENDDLGQKLLETRGFLLLERNTWHDGFFGCCVCDECKNYPMPALNMLGRMLMDLRRRLDPNETIWKGWLK